MSRILFIFASMATLAGAAACDSDDDPLASYRETCRAETRVFKADYTVSPGKLHMMVNGQPQELKGTSAKGDQPAYGIWHLPDWTPPGGDLLKERIYEYVEIDSGRFTVTRMRGMGEDELRVLVQIAKRLRLQMKRRGPLQIAVAERAFRTK